METEAETIAPQQDIYEVFASRRDADVVIVGASKRVEIWDAETWKAMETAELESDDLASIMEQLGIISDHRFSSGNYDLTLMEGR